MEKRLIGVGLLSGGLAGLAALVFARVFAAPVIQRAIDYEAGRDEAQHALDRAAGLVVEEHGHELFSRTVQGTVGLGAGLVWFGLALGALVGVAFAIGVGRTGRLRPRSLALLIAAAGFVGFFVVPFAKYPGNPPAVGDDATIASRASSYLVLVAASLLCLFLAVYFGQRLVARLGLWNATVVGGLGYLLVMGVLFAVLPGYAETPGPLLDDSGIIVYPGFPADVLAQFRVYALANQLILWGVLGLVFAPLAERVLTGARRVPERVGSPA